MFIFSHPWNYQEGIQRQKTQTSKVLVIHLLSVNSFVKIILSIIVAHLQAKIKVFFGCNQTGVSHFTNFQTAKPHFLTSQVKQKAHLIWDILFKQWWLFHFVADIICLEEEDFSFLLLYNVDEMDCLSYILCVLNHGVN